MSKLIVRLHKMILGIPGNKEEAVAHHRDSKKLEDYELGRINSRTNIEYDVKAYHNGGDIEGVTYLSWEESITETARVLIIYSTVTAALIASSGAIAATFGALVPVVIAAAVALATNQILSQKREYVGYFATATGELITQDEADKIKALNRGLIKDKLKEISQLLDFDLEDGERCDLDKAKEELDALSKDHKNILSNDNKQKFQALLADYGKKKIEVEILLADEQSKTLKSIQDISVLTEKAFIDAQRHRDEIYQRQIDHITKVIDGFQELRGIAEEEFAKAKQHREEIKQQLEGAIQVEREALMAHLMQAERRFAEAEEERGAVYQRLVKSIDDSREAVEESRVDAEMEFTKAMKNVQHNHIQQQAQFKSIFAKVTNLRELMMDSFQAAIKERAKEEKEIKEKISFVKASIDKIQIKVKNAFKSFNEKFYLGMENAKEVNAMLSAKLQLEFGNIIKDKKENSEKLKAQMLLSSKTANKKFEEAATRLEEMNEAIQAKIMQVNKEVEESRRQADAQFEKASKQREEINNRILQMTQEVSLEVLKSRKVAADKFEQAAVERKKIHHDIMSGIKEVTDEVLESRRQAEVRFEEARLHAEMIHKETSAKIQKLNISVNKLREDCNINFEKARLHCEEIYQKTATKLEIANSGAHRLREQAQSNFAKELNDASELYNMVEKGMGLLLPGNEVSNRLKAGEIHQIEQLKQISVLYKTALETIDKEQHIEMQMIKSLEPKIGPGGMDSTRIEKYQSKIKDQLEACQKADNFTDKKTHLDAALNIAKEAAGIYGKLYKFEQKDEQNRFMQQELFSIKAILCQQLELEIDKMKEGVLIEMSKTQIGELIRSYSEIEKVKADLESKSYVIEEDYIDKELELTKLQEERVELEDKSKQLSEDLEAIRSMSGEFSHSQLIGGYIEVNTETSQLGELYEAKGD